MVLYDPADGYVDPYGQGGEQVPPGTKGGGCASGQVETQIDASGTFNPNSVECVSPDEADRRRNINYPSTAGGGSKPTAGAGGGGGFPSAKGPNYGPAPKFDGPAFGWAEQWQAPTLADAQNDPGFQFSLQEGLRGLQQSAAAKGHLFTGGTLKDIEKWGGDYANNRYNDVYGRQLQGYQTRFGTAKDTYDRQYARAKDQFAPTWGEWLQNAHGADLGFAAQIQKWLHDNLSADAIWNFGG